MTDSLDLAVTGGTAVTPNGRERVDIGIRGGRIVALGNLGGAKAAQIFDATGLTVLPGVIDTQVHFREPGNEHKEDLESGTRGAVLGGVFSGWVSRVSRQGRAVILCICLWGVAMAGFGLAVGLAGRWPVGMLVVAIGMLIVGGAADMASAAFRQTMLLSAADDAVRGRLQGVFIVVVAGGPRIADTLHGYAAAKVGTAWASGGGGLLVLVLTGLVAVLIPVFWRYRAAA